MSKCGEFWSDSLSGSKVGVIGGSEGGKHLARCERSGTRADLKSKIQNHPNETGHDWGWETAGDSIARSVQESERRCRNVM